MFKIFCLIFVIVSLTMADLPPELKPCMTKDSDCLKEQVEKAIKYFANGKKSFGLLPLDPLKFDKLSLRSGTKVISLNLTYKNPEILGYSKVKVLEVSNNDWKSMHIVLSADKFSLIGEYELDGKIMTLPIQGKGMSLSEWHNAKPIVDLIFKDTIKGGKKYYELTDCKFEFPSEFITFKYDNLFNGNKELGDKMNEFLNKNWKIIAAELAPAISEALEIAFKQIINSIMLKIPADQLIVDN